MPSQDPITIVSPVTKGATKHVFDIDKEFIRAGFQKDVSIDVSYLIDTTDKISVYECLDTGYRFFYPYQVAGDSDFYEKLELIPWYYVEWKWDYEIAASFIQEHAKVLDIGCGEGKFLDFLKSKHNCDCTGLELNPKAVKIAQDKGLNVLNELIETHAEAHEGAYDVVMFYQVLEHISQIDDFFAAAVKALKPGGTLILAVPNNDPYLVKYSVYSLFNLPPHHMGWWNEQSLTALERFYPIQLTNVVKEPLLHYKTYTNGYLKEKFPNSAMLQKILHPFYKVVFYLNRKNIDGSNILTVYTKNK